MHIFPNFSQDGINCHHRQCRLSLHTGWKGKIPRPLLCRTATSLASRHQGATMPTLHLKLRHPLVLHPDPCQLFAPQLFKLCLRLPHGNRPASSSGPGEIKVSRPHHPTPLSMASRSFLIRNSRNMLQPVGQTITKSCLETQSKGSLF